MKKITILSLALISTIGVFAQVSFQNSEAPVKERMENSINTKGVRTPVATITHSSDAVGANIGYNAVQSFAVVAYFPASTMATYDGNVINKIEVGVDPALLTGDFAVAVWTDTTGGAATPAVSQSVELSELSAGWNTINLSTPYAIDGSEIFVGYTCTSTTYGLYMDDQPAEANGYGDLIWDGASWANTSAYGANFDHNFHIKAIVDDGASFSDIALTAMTVPASACDISATSEIVVTVKNNGSDEITDAFDFSYAINEDYAGATAVAVPVPLAAGASVEIPFTLDLSVDGTYVIEAYASVAGDSDNTNDTVMNAVVNTVASVVDAATGYTNTFNSNEEFIGLSIVDNNDDSNSWGFFLEAEGSTNVVAVYQYSETSAADDYIVFNCFDLTAGDYVLSFDYKAQSADYPESLKAYWGTSPEVADLTNEIVDLASITAVDFTNSSTTFSIPADGTYYIGIQAYSAANMYNLWLDNVNLTVSTSINGAAADAISVFPNPANDVVVIENAENATVTIINMVGQVVASQNVNSNRESVNISDLSEGTYVIRIENGTEVQTQKLNVIR